ncbi:hypothetical protein GCM10022224_075560 [Nonomuraea antimicrobica]|uniref:Uncharacterized protein n=1 Tax=Nonomuraea antimicrobica TaxID=561173 RepID=A0ABP7CYR4_9ACTN
MRPETAAKPRHPSGRPRRPGKLLLLSRPPDEVIAPDAVTDYACLDTVVALYRHCFTGKET